MWWPQLEPGSSAETGVSLHKMVSEFLVGRLDEHGLFPEVGMRAVGLGDGTKGLLGEVAQYDSAASG